jgi:hypothetical protein
MLEHAIPPAKDTLCGTDSICRKDSYEKRMPGAGRTKEEVVTVPGKVMQATDQ